MQTGGKFGEDGYRAQISKHDSVHGHHGRVCTNSGGRGGWCRKVISMHMEIWGACVGCRRWVYYLLVVVYENRSFLFDSFPLGKRREWTF